MRDVGQDLAGGRGDAQPGSHVGGKGRGDPRRDGVGNSGVDGGRSVGSVQGTARDFGVISDG